MDTIRIAGIVKQSIVDGTGLRLTVFTQGCPHHCPGCHNPDTHPVDGGYDCPVSNILQELDKNPLLQGITLSGGEPLCQPGQLFALAKGARERGKDIWCYSGYTFEQLLDMAEGNPDLAALLGMIDVLVDGPYKQELRDLTLRFRGSSNQRILDLPRSLTSGKAVELELPA